MKNLVKIIKEETGLSIGEFCDKELNTKYTAFNIRMKRARMYPAEIFYIVYRTRKPIEELFGTSWKDLFINSQGGAIAEKVKAIIEKMSDDEQSQISGLLGFGTPAIVQAREEANVVVTKEPLTEADAYPPAENPLTKLFIKTY